MADFITVLDDHIILKAQHSDDVLVVIPEGDIFGFRYNDLQTEYNRVYPLFDQLNLKNLILDLGQIDFIDSSLIGICISLSKKSRLCGGKSYLCNLSERVREILRSQQLIENDRFEELWKQTTTREEALAAIASV